MKEDNLYKSIKNRLILPENPVKFRDGVEKCYKDCYSLLDDKSEYPDIEEIYCLIDEENIHFVQLFLESNNEEEATIEIVKNIYLESRDCTVLMKSSEEVLMNLGYPYRNIFDKNIFNPLQSKIDRGQVIYRQLNCFY